MQPHACLDHGLHVLKPQSFPPNHAPYMRARHQLLFGGLRMSKEFQHPAIQTKIEQHFGRFFHQIKVCRPIERQDSMQTVIVVDVLFKAYPMVSLSCRSNLAGRS